LRSVIWRSGIGQDAMRPKTNAPNAALIGQNRYASAFANRVRRVAPCVPGARTRRFTMFV